MQYLLAAVAAATVAALLWKAFGPQRPDPPRRVLAPDDDPDFLQELNHRRQEPDGEG